MSQIAPSKNILREGEKILRLEQIIQIVSEEKS